MIRRRTVAASSKRSLHVNTPRGALNRMRPIELVARVLYGFIHENCMPGVPFDEITPDEVDGRSVWLAVSLLRDMQAQGLWQETEKDREAWIRSAQG